MRTLLTPRAELGRHRFGGVAPVVLMAGNAGHADIPLDAPGSGLMGLLLAGGGIGLFVLIWVVLGSAGVDTFARLMVAICVPPALIALGVGLFFLATRSRAE